MKPVIALVGSPNVGKSTLFNKLTRTRDAIVADFPGLTRDRKYGEGQVGGWPYIVIDTGGLIDPENALELQMSEQTWMAVEEADLVLFLLDGRNGLSAADEMIAQELRQRGKDAMVIINKVDGLDEDSVLNDFFSLGLGQPIGIAAAHNRGITAVMERARRLLKPDTKVSEEADPDSIAVAVVGRPNVGKSTLINRLIGDTRVVASDLPGTTRDSIDVVLERDDQRYTLIDTAGVRRRGRVNAGVEKFSVVKTLQAIDRAVVTIVLIDATESLTDQDMHLLGHCVEQGCALIIGINKWDNLPHDHREQVKRDLDRKLTFVNFTEPRFLSALHGTGVGDLLGDIRRCYASAMIEMSTPMLTRTLEDAVSQHPPPLVGGRRIKLRYAHQGGRNPPRVIIHGNQTNSVPDAYKRYLENTFMRTLQLNDTPLKVEFRSGDNPFSERRNTLTPRQVHKKKRLLKRVKGK